ncbi:hypothetical protein [Micromonospora sp. HUAS LYJ1]|uniref:hypothetical protein n=1 Tax=Micromonospora sp. HUAS LYJ1 TaxID=3061626 RepID=UPI0026731A27|nr:hypothetical protein [Micromonospora sp. HUAS LYJ1]WKU07127.1 hypothetical protein Q2K16_08775 [Micromonospora sp. HUAS LYJ1]
MVQETSKLAELISWLRVRDPEIGDDSDLTETVLEDSLRFIELLVYVETLRDAPIAAEMIDLENFRTPHQIHRLFLST